VAFESKDPVVFRDDDVGYLGWVSAHPKGYVLNAARSPSAAYVVLHRADCSTITGEPANGRSWTSQLLKACSDDPRTIENWVREKTGGMPKTCGMCNP
jgi:hypothetical protein